MMYPRGQGTRQMGGRGVTADSRLCEMGNEWKVEPSAERGSERGCGLVNDDGFSLGKVSPRHYKGLK